MQIYYRESSESNLKKTGRPIPFDYNKSLKAMISEEIARLRNKGKKGVTYYLIFSRKEEQELGVVAEIVFKATGIISSPTVTDLLTVVLGSILKDLIIEPHPRIICFSTVKSLTDATFKDLKQGKKMRIGIQLN